MNLNSVSSRPTIPLPSRSSSSLFTRSGTEEITLKKVAAEVYRNVWDEFYRWKAESNAQTLRQLCVEFPDTYQRERDRLSIDEGQDDDWVSDHDYPSSYSSSIDGDEVQVFDYDAAFLSFREPTLDDSSFRVTRYGHIPDELLDENHDEPEFEVDSYNLFIKSAFPGVAAGIDSRLRPHPRYFSCTSTSRNIPDTTDLNKLYFCAFEDDPAFGLHWLVSGFEDLAWQIDFIDPDIEMIQLETVRQLHYKEGLSFVEVNSVKMFSGLRATNQSGLLWNTSQRDLLRWPGMLLSELPELLLSDYGQIPPDDDLSAHLKAGFTNFCPNPNCLLSCCPLHAKTEYPVLDPIQPLLTSEELHSKKKGNPCSDYCFIHLDLSKDSDAEDVHWESAADFKTLECILQLAPDSLPCDLAVIMHVKCQDVFVYRRRLFPDTDINETPVFERSDRLGQLKFVDEPVLEQLVECAKFTPLPPCKHKGPCSRDSGCACFLAQHHCGRNCCCDRRCSIRWKGCRCGVDSHLCSQTPITCPCRLTGRECDPELCRKCYARGKNGKKICRNVDSQRAQYPLIEIKEGSWGLGAFTTSNLKRGQAIGEYTGNYLTSGEDRMEPITIHAKLNYKFDLNKGFLIDSMYAGNEMRYLNHKGAKTEEEALSAVPPHEEANCQGRVIYVNRDHRIVFYTNRRIPANAELFIDYGVKYWTSTDDEDAREKKEIYWR